MKLLTIAKNLCIGFWKEGFLSLLKTVLNHWIITFFVILLVTYLCINSKTAIIAWCLIGIFAVYSAVKAVIESISEIKNYLKSQNDNEKLIAINNLGGKIFDFLLCIVGIFQSLKILSHISKISKSTSSAVSVIDDAASAISKVIDNLTK